VAMVFVVAKAAQPMSGWALEHSLLQHAAEVSGSAVQVHSQ
jgi:hypothetical protein